MCYFFFEKEILPPHLYENILSLYFLSSLVMYTINTIIFSKCILL
jgi:hypothetical protein